MTAIKIFRDLLFIVLPCLDEPEHQTCQGVRSGRLSKILVRWKPLVDRDAKLKVEADRPPPKVVDAACSILLRSLHDYTSGLTQRRDDSLHDYYRMIRVWKIRFLQRRSLTLRTLRGPCGIPIGGPPSGLIGSVRKTIA